MSEQLGRRPTPWPNPSIERTSYSRLRRLQAAAHVERWASQEVQRNRQAICRKSFSTSQSVRKLGALRAPEVRGNPQKLLAALTEIEESQHAGLGGLFRVWVATVVIALGGAFAGAAVLVYAFTGGLAR